MSGADCRTLFSALAGELQAMSRSIEQLGSALCRDPGFAANHVSALQELDRIAQMQVGIAAIISADDPVTACRQARLEHLGMMIADSVTIPPQRPSADQLWL